MTENEAITYLGYFKNWNNDDRWLSDETMEEFVKCCVEALKEIQKYREVGTVEEIKTAKKYIDLKKECGTPTNTIDVCAEYVAIGTVEECREAVELRRELQELKERDTAKPPVEFDGHWYKCPACGKYSGGLKGNYCFNCGQRLQREETEDEN